MNIYSEVHKSPFKIVYRGTKGSGYESECLVCDFCHEKRYFATPKDVFSIKKLD